MKRVLVANRGEIALRIVRACRRAGMESVAVYSEADRHCPHVWAADQAVCIGPARSAESYLDGDRLLLAAEVSRADGIHPGYGFLAENPEFARACRAAGLTFVGPAPEHIEGMGDKVQARVAAARNGVSVVPGSERGYAGGELAEARQVAEEVGFPLLLKAAAGGGGRGMRVVPSPSEFDERFRQAAREAEGAFGDGTLYMERYIEAARHIEVQVFGDRHGNHRHYGERDCTLQRRHQKLMEESPSPALNEAQREEVCAMAVALARGIGYVNAGTVEFLFEPASGAFFFIEMNTRIQVEHPVTEMVTGMDLVAQQLRVADGGSLESPRENGGWAHAIEWRINAEDPARDFTPSPGMLQAWGCRRAREVRLDSHVYPGYTVPPYYDSLLGKLIVAGASREDVLARSRRVLADFRVSGVATTIPFFLRLMEEPDFVSGDVHTRWVDDNLGRLYERG